LGNFRAKFEKPPETPTKEEIIARMKEPIEPLLEAQGVELVPLAG
jgi:hypothetical protein